jgi:uncharacterized protein YndB with AHSA1/START domain
MISETKVGKTTARTDTYHGRFIKLVPNELLVEVDEFETADPALRGEMTITITLGDADGDVLRDVPFQGEQTAEHRSSLGPASLAGLQQLLHLGVHRSVGPTARRPRTYGLPRIRCTGGALGVESATEADSTNRRR